MKKILKFNVALVVSIIWITSLYGAELPLMLNPKQQAIDAMKKDLTLVQSLIQTMEEGDFCTSQQGPKIEGIEYCIDSLKVPNSRTVHVFITCEDEEVRTQVARSFMFMPTGTMEVIVTLKSSFTRSERELLLEALREKARKQNT